MMWFIVMICCLAVPVVAQSEQRPVPRVELPAVQWERDAWTRATMAAVLGHGRALVELVPGDIAQWCPAYAESGPRRRAAFWTGMISALARYESTHRARAVGGGGRWFGLTQISPATARGYGCRARSGQALLDGAANLSCAVRIMSATVARDGVVARKNGENAGVAADWGPMTKASLRAEMAAFTRAQSYCQPRRSLVPKPRPDLGALSE